MSKLLTRELIADHATVVAEPQISKRAPTTVDRSFELPTGIYVATAVCYLVFLATLVAAFGSPGLIIPIAIIVMFIGMFFGVPAAWTRMAPDSRRLSMSWSHFSSRGISTLTGRLTAGEAAVQVLILPVLVVLWGLAVAVIAAFLV